MICRLIVRFQVLQGFHEDLTGSTRPAYNRLTSLGHGVL